MLEVSGLSTLDRCWDKVNSLDAVFQLQSIEKKFGKTCRCGDIIY